MKTNQFLYSTVWSSVSMLTLTVLLVGAPAVTEASFTDMPKVEKVAVADKVAICEIGNLKVQVILKKPVDERVLVSIIDADRNTLYSGSWPRPNPKVQVFDLSHLDDGSYAIEVAVGSEKVSQSFAIKTQINRVVLAQN